MGWFALSPEQRVAKDGFKWKYRGEASARVLDRLADQAEEEGLDDKAEEEHEEAEQAREALHARRLESARKAVAKSGGSVVFLGGIGAVVFNRK